MTNSIPLFPERRRLIMVWVVLALTVSSCQLFQPAPDPAVPPPVGPEPIGPVIIIGQGIVPGGAPWRYSVYESRDGWCTQLETGQGGQTNCGVSFDIPQGRHVVLGGGGSATGIRDSYEGLASTEVAEVWLEGPGEVRVATALMEPGPVGKEVRVFVAFVPARTPISWIVAFDESGVEVDRVEVDLSP